MVYLLSVNLKLMMIIIVLNNSQETMVFNGRQKLTSATILRLEKGW